MRKRICVILIGLQSETARRTVEGISAQAEALNYDVYVYSYFGLCLFDEKTVFGEANILTLIGSDDYDAFIVHKGIIADTAIREQIIEICKNSGKPVIDIDDPDKENEEYPLWNDREKFRILTEHLLTVHHHKKIYCITGFKGFHQSENRLLGYRDALKAHGIRPHSEWEFYGDFWKEYAATFAERLAKGELSMPDAIVCAATIPAVTLIEELKKYHIHVPKDVSIVGYDCFAEVLYEQPSVTFISFPNYNQGIQCVCRIHKMLTGESISSDLYFEEKLCTLDSCGCHTPDNPSFLWLKNDLAEQFTYMDFFRNSGMQETLSLSADCTDCFHKLYNLNYLIRGLKTIHYCLCEDWDAIAYTGEGEYRKTGFSEQILIYSHEYPEGEKFNIKHKDEITEFVSSTDEAGTYFFFPLHYSDRVFGFVSMKFKDVHYMPDALLWNYLELLENALENIRIRYYITRFSERKRLTALRDNLTGFYNRRGFEELSSEMFSHAVSHQEQFSLTAVKLYCLEQINWILGYETGDKILLLISDIIGKFTRGNEIVCRYSGGKFYIIGTHPLATESFSPETVKKQFLKECQKQLAPFEQKLHIELEMEFFCDFIQEQALDDIISVLNIKLNQKHTSTQKHLVHMRNIYDLRKEIYQNPQKHWTVKELAGYMALSDAYFQRMYKKTFQVSISADIIHARIEMAKQLLSTGKGITETANLCGYHTDSYFMQQFKKETGMTPTEWKHYSGNQSSEKRS